MIKVITLTKLTRFYQNIKSKFIRTGSLKTINGKSIETESINIKELTQEEIERLNTIGDKADDNAVVHITKEEAIEGKKVFLGIAEFARKIRFINEGRIEFDNSDKFDKISLSDNKTLQDVLDKKQELLTPGSNINIEEDEKGNVVISSTGGGGGVADEYTTAVKVGELDAGIDVKGKTALEILQLILDAEYAPKWTDATVSISGGKTVSVGDNVPSLASFTVSGSTAKTEGKTTAYGGSSTDSVSVSNNALGESGRKADFGDKVIKRGSITVNVSRTYGVGNDVCVTSKGNPTNKTATNNTTKISKATTNTNIDAITFKIKSITKNNSTTVNFAYPVYIDNVQQTLGFNTTSYEKTKAIASGESITFSIPSTYTNRKVEYYDSVTQKWVDITSSCSESTADKSIGSNNISVNYRTYSFNEVSGSRAYRVSFTIV